MTSQAGSSPQTNALPSSIRDIAESLSLPIALKLLGAFGGCEIKFPKRPNDDHPVIQALGKEDGLALCNFLSGCMIYVPNCKTGNIRAEVLALEAAGKERREIARTLGVSQRHVRRMANKASNPNQFNLFDTDRT